MNCTRYQRLSNGFEFRGILVCTVKNWQCLFLKQTYTVKKTKIEKMSYFSKEKDITRIFHENQREKIVSGVGGKNSQHFICRKLGTTFLLWLVYFPAALLPFPPSKSQVVKNWSETKRKNWSEIKRKISFLVSQNEAKRKRNCFCFASKRKNKKRKWDTLPMHQCTKASKHLCARAQMWQCTNARLHQHIILTMH